MLRGGGVFGRGVKVFSLSEPSALAVELPCSPSEAIPLRRGPMTVRITRIALGDVLLQTARSTPLAILGTLSPKTVVVALPLAGRESMVLNGLAVLPHPIATYGAGASYEATSPSDGIVTVTLAGADWRTGARLVG
jgi:hypothetical protein